jgi:acetoin utilization deacetylase AcuC-like enzyme
MVPWVNIGRSNVAIGAKYAQNKYGIGRVAVLDFDVHHGNGEFPLFL